MAKNTYVSAQERIKYKKLFDKYMSNNSKYNILSNELIDAID